MITQSINLNLIPGGVLPRINVSQYDKGSRTLQFVLFDGPVLYSIESGTEITIQGSKPDNTAFQYSCTWSGSTVSMDIEQQMTAVEGDVICELVISNNGEILGTCNFILNVESAAVSDDTVISETELPLIERAVEAAVEAAASAASAAQSAEDASGYVETVQTAAQNAAQSATAASSSAGTAQTAAQSAAQSATDASSSAGTAQTAAQSAAQSATAASSSAGTAQTAAQNAAQSATDASGSASSASQSATAAAASAQAAAQSAASMTVDSALSTASVNPVQNKVITAALGKVKEIIAPVETDPATNAWAVGSQIIYNDNLFEVIAAISAGDSLVAYEDDPTNANIELADPVETQVLVQKTQIQTLTKDLTLEVDTRKRFNVDNLIETTLSGSWTYNDTSFSVNPDKSITATIISTLSADENYPIVNMWSGFDISDHIGNRLIITGCNDSFRLLFVILDSSSQEIYNFMCPDNGSSFIVPSGSVKCRAIMSIKAGITSGTSYTYYPRLSVAMTNQELTPIAQAVSNRNLLDNPWFTVNQRGQASYTGSVYGFDRWKLTTSAISKSNGIITFETTMQYASLSQFLELDTLENGKTYTLSVLLADGTLVHLTFVYNISNDWIFVGHIDSNYYATYRTMSNYIEFLVFDAFHASSNSIAFKAIKLELGSVSTLAMDVAPNYQQELAKCQRYFQKLDGGLDYVTLGMGSATSATSLNINVPLCVPMRVNPSVNITADEIIFIGNSQFLMDSTFTVSGDAYTPTSKRVAITAPNVAMTQNALYYVDLNKTSNKPVIELSADL